MPIRWDALLTRHVAQVLHRALAGARLRAFRLDGESRDLFLVFRERTLIWRLHPSRGAPSLREAIEIGTSDLRYGGKVRRIHAPPDERLIRIELMPTGSGRGRDVFVELMGNQWNAVVTEGPEMVARHVLWSRATGRGHRVGERYEPPAPSGRIGGNGDLSETDWHALLDEVPSSERARVLVRTVAWTSPINAPALLGEDVDGDARERLRRGFERWHRLATMTAPDEPVILHTERGPQPYGTSLPGVPARAVPELLHAFGAADEGASGEAGAPAPSLLDPELTRRLADAAARADRRRGALEAELNGLADPAVARALGDLILARYADIPSGSERVTVRGFDGEEVHLELDPTRPPHENASRYYDEAARIERARERLPRLLQDVTLERERLATLLARARAGTVERDEVERALPERPARSSADASAPSLPYRSFRSSGGLEIRVGRGAKHNDALTFHHALPNDVWMHARHAAGAHVVLRWSGPGNPPARDLEEAAILAALHSKARTSGSVPVDWTLRKHVRKPRKAARGSVVPERVKTLFVRPDPALVERLEEEGRRAGG